jgi:hypothetical protein
LTIVYQLEGQKSEGEGHGVKSKEERGKRKWERGKRRQKAVSSR